MSRQRIIIALTIAALLTIATVAARAQAATIPGDANGDGILTYADYELIRGSVSGLQNPRTPEEVDLFNRCDTDRDGRLTPADFDRKERWGAFDNPPLGANSKPVPGNYYPRPDLWVFKVNLLELGV